MDDNKHYFEREKKTSKKVEENKFICIFVSDA